MNCCQNGEGELPQNGEAAIMDVAEGNYECVGETVLNPAEYIQESTDPILVTFNSNWKGEMDGSTCNCGQLPQSEFVLTRQILDMQGRVLDPEKEMTRMIEAAPGFNAPVVSNLQYVDPQELNEDILPARMIYRIYVRAYNGTARSVNPYKLLVRQYPEKD